MAGTADSKLAVRRMRETVLGVRDPFRKPLSFIDPFSALYVEGSSSSHGPSGGRSSLLSVAIALIGCPTARAAVDSSPADALRCRAPACVRRLREKPRIGRALAARQDLQGVRSMSG